jgi:hypothetical protein
MLIFINVSARRNGFRAFMFVANETSFHGLYLL